MKYDSSRITFHKEKHYSKVLMQQGRVQVDADWNEQQEINKHRIDTEALDIIGECGAPMGNNAGFEITIIDDDKLKIGKGRYYVDGILCENDSDDVTYDNQPDLPDPPDMLDVLKEVNAGIIYLDVWQRHITALDDPLIREVALGGPDTSNRAKTVWQVKILPVNTQISPENCDSQFTEWDELVTPSTGTLNAHTQPPENTDNPCLLPPGAGYQRLENQLYRIEIHKGGSLGTATFKWSRDNGSVITSIEKTNNLEITVHDVGLDDVMGFANGQWAEVVDDITELNGQPGQIVQIDNVNPATRVITLKSSPTGVNPIHNPKLRRWDSADEIKVEVPASNDGWISIEAGIEVQFSSGNYNAGDYWLIPARTAMGEIEWPPYEIPNLHPINQLPLGIQHHYCRLAIIQRNPGNELDVQDCRKIFPPLTGTKESGIHIINVLAGDKPLRNDTEVLVNNLDLRIEFDETIVSSTIKGKPTCFVTLDMPFPINEADRRLWVGVDPVIGFQPLILAANVEAQGKVVLWAPTPKSKKWLEEMLFGVMVKLKLEGRILAHLTLKGNFIWALDNPEQYLDGEVFGFSGPGGNIDIHLASGDRSRGGDFEMWFWLVPPGSISGMNFEDSNRDGRRSSDEAPLDDWKIILKDSSGTKVTTITDTKGTYIFKDLVPGTYTVEEVIKQDWEQTAPQEKIHTVTLTAGFNVTGKDFGNFKKIIIE